jgi:acyl-CoA synthetase (AMP-forming)/AMP-acid ligase II
MFPAIPGPPVVAAVLRRHPCVLDAAAVQIADRSGKQVMAAVVRLAAPLPDAPAELARYCRRHLPPAQVPAAWIITDAPVRAARRPWDAAAAEPGSHRIPPQAPRAPHLDLLGKTTP